MERSRDVVLLADDNGVKRYLVRRWLERAGYAVTEAGTGADALRAAQEQPALVILDIRLPDIDGFEVCRRLKASPRTGHIPVLHLSSQATSLDDRVHGLDSGADGYLTHPVDPEELTATIRALLRVRSAEAALRASEERYRLVQRATNDVIWDWDLATDEVQWTVALLPVLGHRVTSGTRRLAWWREQIHPDDRARVVHGQQVVIDGTGETWADEYRFRRGDGSWAVVFDRGYVLHDERGAPVRMIGSMLDVTQRRRAEEAQHLLADAGAVLAGMLDADAALASVARLAVPRLADWCVASAYDERARRLEPRAVAAADAARERPLHALAAADLGDASAPAAWVEETLRTGETRLLSPLPPVLAEQARAAGLPAVSCAIVAPLLARGRVLGALVFAAGPDMPCYGAMERSLAADLAGRTALAVDNAHLYDTAVFANRVKADFLAMMSHELRTPLNAVVGYADLLMLGIPHALETESREHVRRVQACARHLLTLIEQILTFSRVEAGREPVDREPVDVSLLVEETARLVEPLVHLKGLRYHRECAPRLPVIESDAGKLRQILLNLLSNAAKFTERGEIAVRAVLDDGALVVSVRDTGPGIPPEHLDRIFDPFWQVEQRRTRKVGGTGLGLTVSRQLAQLLGGTLTVESAPGAGSTFRFRLPLDARAVAAERGADHAANHAPDHAAVRAPLAAEVPDGRAMSA